jgi:hypothetical protein
VKPSDRQSVEPAAGIDAGRCHVILPCSIYC